MESANSYNLSSVDQKRLDQFIELGLLEDIGNGDHTSNACIPPGDTCSAYLLVKDEGILAGIEIARAIFKKVDPDYSIQIFKTDGEWVSFGEIAFNVSCNTRALLKAERLILNTMQRMSGIATLCNRFAFEVEDLPVKILDTRKTTPMIRFLEKWAVRIGGCNNYRDGLYDWIMIKDNHVDACGGVKPAIERVHKYLKENQLDLEITVEVRNLVELYEAIETGGFKRIMLDNFEIPLMKEAVAIVDGRFETEASGGVTIHKVRMIGKTGVDYISAGALTHSAQSFDLSLKVRK